MDEKNRRLVFGDSIIYPFTRHQNVIGLQKQITDKLPIISETQPSENFVRNQSWFQLVEEEAEEQQSQQEAEISYGGLEQHLEQPSLVENEIVTSGLEIDLPALEGTDSSSELEDDSGNASGEIELEQN